MMDIPSVNDGWFCATTEGGAEPLTVYLRTLDMLGWEVFSIHTNGIDRYTVVARRPRTLTIERRVKEHLLRRALGWLRHLLESP